MRINKFLRMVLIVSVVSSLTSFLSAAVMVKDTGWLWDKDENNDGHGDLKKIYWMPKGNTSYFQREVTFDTGKRKITLIYRTSNDPSLLKPGQKYHSGDIGMWTVGLHSGWYGNGFIDILVNGLSLLRDYKPEITSESKGEEAKASYTWDTPEAKIRMTFTAKSGDDKIFLRVNIEPKKGINSIETRLLCFPSSFGGRGGSGPKIEPIDRWISTYKRDIQHTQKVTLQPDEFWILYYDKIWDRAKKEKCGGPCALLFPPNEPEKVTIDVKSYDIVTCLTYPPTTREMHYLFWPGMGISNEEALKRMKELKLK